MGKTLPCHMLSNDAATQQRHMDAEQWANQMLQQRPQLYMQQASSIDVLTNELAECTLG